MYSKSQLQRMVLEAREKQRKVKRAWRDLKKQIGHRQARKQLLAHRRAERTNAEAA